MTELQASVESLHTRFHKALLDLKQITHMPSREDHLAYVDELIDEAEFLKQNYGDQLHPLVNGKLTHIINYN